jgi:hypothetical protein
MCVNMQPQFKQSIVFYFRYCPNERGRMLFRRIPLQELLGADCLTSGKVEQVSVRRSPESQLVGPLVEALEHWIFQPAQIDGRPVALKILLGIRLAASR